MGFFTWSSSESSIAGDPNAIHIDEAGEINGLTAKATPIGADLLLIEDSADAFNKKKIAIDNIPKDPNAFKSNVEGEIDGLTAKGTPVGADLLLIEDSADTLKKKKILISDLPSSGGSGEVNTASNAGTGVEVFKEKSALDLVFRSLVAGSTKVAIALSGLNEISIDVVNANLAITESQITDLQTYALQSALDTTNSNVSANTTAIGTKADQSSLDTTNSNVSANASAIVSNNSFINNNITAIDNLNNLVSVNTGNISSNTTAIGTKADQTSLNTTNSNVSANTTAIGTKADQSSLDTTNSNVSANTTAIGTKYQELFGDSGNKSGASSIDFSGGNMQEITLTGNVTSLSLSTLNSGGAYIIVLKQDATGGRTVTWPAGFKWPDGTAPTLSTAPNAIDIVSFLFDGTNGYAIWQGAYS